MIKLTDFIIETSNLMEPGELLINRNVLFKNKLYRISYNNDLFTCGEVFEELSLGKYKYIGKNIKLAKMTRMVNAGDQKGCAAAWRIDAPPDEVFIIEVSDKIVVELFD